MNADPNPPAGEPTDLERLQDGLDAAFAQVRGRVLAALRDSPAFTSDTEAPLVETDAEAEARNKQQRRAVVRRIDVSRDGRAFVSTRHPRGGQDREGAVRGRQLVERTITPLRQPIRLSRVQGARPRRPVCAGRERQSRGRADRRRGPPKTGEPEQDPEPAARDAESATRATCRAEPPLWLQGRQEGLSAAEKLRDWCLLPPAARQASGAHIQRLADADPQRASVLSDDEAPK